MVKIFQYFTNFWKQEQTTLDRGIYNYANDMLKHTISGSSWLLYIIAVLFIISCFSYLHFERKKRRIHQQRLRELQLLIERPPPKRRPGAVAREREVFQNVLKTAHSYIYPKDESMRCVIRQTRSGTIYGKFVEPRDQNTQNGNRKN